MALPQFEPLGDQALLLRWSESMDPAANREVHALAATLRANPAPWLIDCVPAYASLAVFFDSAAVDGDDPVSVVREWLVTMIEATESQGATVEPRLVEIPACYDGEHAPDLADVALTCGLTATQVIEKHSQADYLVAMLGFAPGFPYLLGLDPTLVVPRLATPRTRVPAGSIGIGGAQTGIYPQEGPGGWRLIARTPQRLFDAGRDTPALLLPGDRVRFVPIDARRYQQLLERDA